jgi:hypothetical protein
VTVLYPNAAQRLEGGGTGVNEIGAGLVDLGNKVLSRGGTIVARASVVMLALLLGGCSRGDSLNVVDLAGAVESVELISQERANELEQSDAWPWQPEWIDAMTLRIPFSAGATCRGGDSVDVAVTGGGRNPVVVTIEHKDNGDDCDDEGNVRLLDVTFREDAEVSDVEVIEEPG